MPLSATLSREKAFNLRTFARYFSRMTARFQFFIILLFLSSRVAGQQPDTLAIKKMAMNDSTVAVKKIKIDTSIAQNNLKIDSAVVKKSFLKRTISNTKTFFTKDYPKPKRALWLSYIFPGAGQAYNRSWWKLPLVYGTLGGLGWLENHNWKAYKELKTNYYNKVNNLPVPFPYDQIDATSIKYRRDVARSNFETSTFILILSYFLIGAEAYTDAHLKRFDVSDDLSFHAKPVFFSPDIGQIPALGMGIAVNFHRPHVAIPVN